MKPVNQTLFGDKVGNCFAACVASILELPIEEVPNFCADVPEEEDWLAVFRSWCSARGVLTMPFWGIGSRGIKGMQDWAGSEVPSLPYIACGDYEGPGGTGRHAVVHQGGALIHNPNPNHHGTDLKRVLMVLFLVRAP